MIFCQVSRLTRVNNLVLRGVCTCIQVRLSVTPENKFVSHVTACSLFKSPSILNIHGRGEMDL